MANTERQVKVRFDGSAAGFNRAARQAQKEMERFRSGVTKASAGASLAIAGLGAATVAGAATAALALAAVPIAFAAIGIAAVKENAKVKAAFTGLKTHVVAETKKLAAPLIPVLEQVAGKLRTAFDGIAPQLGQIFQAIGPLILRLTDGLTAFVSNAMPGFTAAIKTAGPVIDALSAGLGRIGTAVGTLFTKLSGESGNAAAGLTILLDAVVWLIGAIGDLLVWFLQLLPTLVKWKTELMIAAGFLLGLAATIKIMTVAIAAYRTIMTVVSAVTKAWAAVQWLLNAALLANPIGLIIIAVVALVAGIILLWNNCETFRNIVMAVWEGVKAAFSGGVNFVKTAIAWFGQLPGLISGWFNSAKNFAVSIFNSVVSFVAGIPGRIFGVLAGLAALAGRIGGYVSGAFNAAVAWFGRMVSYVAGIPGRVLGALGNLGGLLLNSGRALVDGFLNGIKGAWNAVVGFVRQGVQWVRDLFPFSPAKTGPFSGSGYVTHSGKALTTDFAKSLRAGMPGVIDAASGLMSAANMTLAPRSNMAPTFVAQAGVTEVKVLMDGDEFKGLVRTEINSRDRSTKRTVGAGRLR